MHVTEGLYDEWLPIEGDGHPNFLRSRPFVYKTVYNEPVYMKSKKKAFRNSLLRKALRCGRHWTRTSDFHRVRMAL